MFKLPEFRETDFQWAAMQTIANRLLNVEMDGFVVAIYFVNKDEIVVFQSKDDNTGELNVNVGEYSYCDGIMIDMNDEIDMFCTSSQQERLLISDQCSPGNERILFYGPGDINGNIDAFLASFTTYREIVSFELYFC